MVVLGKLRLRSGKSNLQPPTGGGFGGRGTMGIIPMHWGRTLDKPTFGRTCLKLTPPLPPRLADGFIDSETLSTSSLKAYGE